MKEQAEATEKRLRDLFDPHLYSTPRADLPLRSKEFMTALSFYLQRAARYELLGPDRLTEALAFVDSLDSGYSVDTSLLGVVFERQGTGAHLDEEEPGFSVHRFGFDVAQRLLWRACGVAIPHDGATDSGSAAPPTPHQGSPVGGAEPDAIISSFAFTVEGIAPARKKLAVPQVNASKPASSILVEQPAEKSPQGRVSEPPVKVFLSTTHAPQLKPEKEARDANESQMSPPSESTPFPEIVPGVLLGAHALTPQFGILGRHSDATVAIDLTGCNTVSLFGVQGFGKSYTLGVISEMSTTGVPGINVLPAPLATVIFHYHKSDAYAPEFASSQQPNNKPREVGRLLLEYGAQPQGVGDIVILTPEAKVNERKAEFPGLKSIRSSSALASWARRDGSSSWVPTGTIPCTCANWLPSCAGTAKT
jgi:hypothetical protein